MSLPIEPNSQHSQAIFSVYFMKEHFVFQKENLFPKVYWAIKNGLRLADDILNVFSGMNAKPLPPNNVAQDVLRHIASRYHHENLV